MKPQRSIPNQCLTALVIIFFSAPFVNAQTPLPLTVETYVQIEAEIRALTNASMQQRVILQDGSVVSKAQTRRIAEQVQKDIQDVFQAFQTSPSAHSYFGTRHAKDIAIWLDQHPDWLQQMNALQEEFASLANRFSPPVNGGQNDGK